MSKLAQRSPVGAQCLVLTLVLLVALSSMGTVVVGAASAPRRELSQNCNNDCGSGCTTLSLCSSRPKCCWDDKTLSCKSLSTIPVTKSSVGTCVPTITSCPIGQYLSNGACFACKTVPGCAGVTCTSGSSSTCTKCSPGYALVNGACKPCPSGSYSLDGLTCTACPAAAASLNCATSTCNPTTGIDAVCTSCPAGSYLSNGACLACASLPGCATVTCDGRSKSSCNSCLPGFGMQREHDDGHADDHGDDGRGSCQRCSPGFFSPGGTAKCSSCKPINGCARDGLTCTTSSDSSCSRCKPGWYLDGGICKACTASAGCSSSDLTCTGSSAAETVCASCLPGYSLTNGACDTCQAGYGIVVSPAGVRTCESCAAKGSTWYSAGGER